MATLAICYSAQRFSFRTLALSSSNNSLSVPQYQFSLLQFRMHKFQIYIFVSCVLSNLQVGAHSENLQIRRVNMPIVRLERLEHIYHESVFGE